MELTIHSVERLQQRTKLSLQKLRLMFASNAVLLLGEVAGTSYSLLFDPRQNKCVISCVRDGVLVTILHIQYDVPAEIRSKITLQARNAAKQRYYAFFYKKSEKEIDSVTITLSIYEHKSLRAICSENIKVVANEGVHEVSSADLMRICLTECDRMLTVQNLVKPLSTNLRVELTLTNVENKLLRNVRYKLADVMAIRDINTGPFCTLIIRDMISSYEYPLDFISLEHVRSDSVLLKYFSAEVAKIVSVLSGAMSAKRLKELRYCLFVADLTTGILIRKVYRKHSELTAEESNWASL